MEAIKATSALYIKLGEQSSFAKQCINEGILKIGWEKISHEDCLNKEWDKVKEQQRKHYAKPQTPKNAISNQVNQIKKFYETDENVLWITFYNNLLYWCIAEKEVIIQEDYSRIRKTVDGWKCTDIDGTLLKENRLSGKLTAIQGYRSVICDLNDMSQYLINKINGIPSEIVRKANHSRDELIQAMEDIIKNFHPMEFELLVDLIFRQSGWTRISTLGKTMSNIDLELFSPLTNETIKVQVKANAEINEYREFQTYKNEEKEKVRFYFVAQPDKSLEGKMDDPDITVWTPKELASLSMSYGLVDWILERAW